MEHVTLSIMGREYRLACAPEEKAALLQCAQYVDGKMLAIKDAGKVMGADRIAVMAALQIAHELFNARDGAGVEVGELQRRLRDLLQTCDEALLPQEKLSETRTVFPLARSRRELECRQSIVTLWRSRNSLRCPRKGLSFLEPMRYAQGCWARVVV